MKKELASVAFMFALMLAFTSLLTVVKGASQDRIERNQKAKLQGLILSVLGIPAGFESGGGSIADIYEARVREIEAEGRRVFLGLAPDRKKVTGLAFLVSGPGFWGPVNGLVAVDPSASRIIGLAFYRHSETPGLGGRMTEKWFQQQFAGLALKPARPGPKYFTLVPAGAPRGPGSLDAITGATQTSRAIEAFLNREIDIFLKNTFGAVKNEVESNGQDPLKN